MRSKTLIILLLAAVLVFTGCGHKEKPAQTDPAADPQGEAAEQPAEEPEEPQMPMMATSLDDYPLDTPTDDILVLA